MNEVNNEKNNKRIGGITGKGFVKGDPRINRKGAPKRGQSWSEAVKRITDMTREEAIEYVGANSKIGRQLKDLSPAMPIKDALIFATIIAYGREPNARMLSAIMDREDGKPAQAIDLSNKDGTLQKVIVEYVDDTTPAPAQSAKSNQDESKTV